MGKLKTHKQFVEELKIKNQKLTLLDGELYINQSTKLKFTCNKNNHTTILTPKDALKGCGCGKCPKKPRKTHSRFMAELNQIHPDITLATGQLYITAKNHLKFMCNQNHCWWARPANILRGTGCPKCFGKNKSTIEFISELKLKNTTLHLKTGEHYKNSYTKLQFMCVNNHEITMTPTTALQGIGCAKCSKKQKRTTENFIKEITERNPLITLKENECYINTNTHLLFKCVFGHEWKTTPKIILKGFGCPLCSKRNYSTLAVEWLTGIAKKYNITISHAENGGEFKIPTTNYRVDGFCAQTNTVYEFYGDAYHGNPKKYKPTETCHPYNKNITAAELHYRTQQRAQKIKSLGFTLIEIWQSDYLKTKS